MAVTKDRHFKRIKMKKIALLIIAISATLVVKAQAPEHYLNVGGQLGLAGYRYDVLGEDAKPQFGIGGSCEYTYYFHHQWGIHTGITFASYSTKANIGLHQLSFENQADSEGDIFRRDVYLESWKEKQRTLLLTVPISIRFKQPISDAFDFYADAGFEVQLPISGKYKIDGGTIEGKAYYPKWNIYLENLPEHGLSKDNSSFPNGNAKQRVSLAALLKLGFAYKLNDRYSIYLGATSAIGITNAKNSSNKYLVQVDENGTTSYNGIVASNTAGKMRSISIMGEFGVNIKLGK